MGGDAILDTLESELGVHAGQTTADGLITLEHIECNAACDYAPVVMVNWEFSDNQTPSKGHRIRVRAAIGSGRPSLARHHAVPVPGDRAHAVGVGEAGDAGGAPGAATLAGLEVFRESEGLPC